MKRRDFFKYLTGAGAALVIGAGEVDIDRILWVPGEKTIFLPPQRIIIPGEEAAMALFESVDGAALPLRSALFARKISTAAGEVWVDANENVISVQGRNVGAQEAARLRLMMFNRSNKRPTDAQMNEMVSRVINERVAAGWKDPVGEKPWHFPIVMVPKKLDLERT